MLAAAIVLVATALVHSVLGEILILRHLRADHYPRFLRSDALAARTVHVTWHLPSILGVALAAILAHEPRDRFTVDAIAAALAVCGVAVVVATRGRHPGWVAFFTAATLTWLNRP